MKNLRILLMVVLLCMTLNANSQESFSATKQAVYKHYSAKSDSLKRKAADYLFKFMQYHYFKSSNIQEDFQKETFEALNKGTISYYDIDSSVDEVYAKYNKIFFADTISEAYHQYWKQMDGDVLSADYIINNIDKAFESWNNDSWSKHLSFQQFCEYILPYRIGNEKAEEWRDNLRKEYMPQLSMLLKIEDRKKSAYWAASYLNNALKKKHFSLKNLYYYKSNDLPVSVLDNMQTGTHKQFAMLTGYVMRSCGIPVTVDFTPMVNLASTYHYLDEWFRWNVYWNTVLDNTGKFVPFVGGWSNPGYPCFDGYKLPKVYRYTYEYQPESLGALNEKFGEEVPKDLESPFIKDVTDEYTSTTDLSFDLSDTDLGDSHFVYLVSLGDNNIPYFLDFAQRTKKGKVVFDKVGKDMVYLPALYKMTQSKRYIGYPVWIKANGEKQILKPDTKNDVTLEMDRIYPVVAKISFKDYTFKDTNFDNGPEGYPEIDESKGRLKDGKVYTLNYFDKNGEVVDQRQNAKCTNGKLCFTNVPSNALMYVSLEDGNDIYTYKYFTVEDGKIVWL